MNTLYNNFSIAIQIMHSKNPDTRMLLKMDFSFSNLAKDYQHHQGISRLSLPYYIMQEFILLKIIGMYVYVDIDKKQNCTADYRCEQRQINVLDLRTLSPLPKVSSRFCYVGVISCKLWKILNNKFNIVPCLWKGNKRADLKKALLM